MASSGSSTPGGMSEQSTSGPWRPPVWTLGGIPKQSVDIPVTSVFLFLFIVGAAVHMTIFQLNKRRGHKFLFNAVTFGFCMARTTTCILRIASTSLPSNIRLALAAQIFVAAGVLILFIINLIFAQRILRAHHPFGWHRSVTVFFAMLYVLIGFTLAIVITAVVQSYYTLRPRTRTIDRALQLYGSTLFTVIAFLPIAVVALALLLPSPHRVEKFGRGRHRTRIAVLLLASTLCTLGAAFRAGTSYLRPVPLSQPQPEYFHRGYFYFFNFGIEVLVVYLYAIMRVDLRFWVPNGARGVGSYRTITASKESSSERNNDEGPRRGSGKIEA